MLSIGAGLTPDDGSGLIVDGTRLQVNVLAVALHLELLEVSWKTPQMVRVGHDTHGLRAEEIVVPHSKQTHQHWQVPLRRRGAEVFVHGVEPGEHLLVILRTDRDHGGQPDRRIHRIAAANPIPKAKHVGRIYPELRYLARIGRN